MQKPLFARIVAPVAIAVAAAACGSDSPMTTAAPTTINLGGAWTGTWQFLTAGVTVTDTVTATLTQSGSQVTAGWTAASGATGTLAFAAAAGFTGPFTINEPALGFTCTGSGQASGTAAVDALAFDVPSIGGSGCQWSTNNHFALHR